MIPRIQRSMLILPAHIRRFTEKAHLRDADAIVLDLEDAVPLTEKKEARKFLPEVVTAVGRGGADVLVRINNEPDLFPDDLASAVCQGLHGIFVPKVETTTRLREIGEIIQELERKNGMEAGSVKLSLQVESPRGVRRITDILTVTDRTESVSLGVDDYCLELGVEPSGEGLELLYPLSFLVLSCKDQGVIPLGILGSVAQVRDLAAFEQAAIRGRQLGCEGAYCVHPDQVKILNRVFSPSPEAVEYAQRVVEAFEEGLATGRAAITLDGKMIDTPVYKRAKCTLHRAFAIAETERRKAAALERLR